MQRGLAEPVQDAVGGGRLPESPFSWGPLVALALAAAGVGFAVYVYAVPYQGLVVELKRRSGDSMAAQTAAETRLKELERIKRELVEIRGESNQNLGHSGRVRSELKLLKIQFEERLKDYGVTISINDKSIVVRFPEEALFDGHGANFSRAGQTALQAVAQSLTGRTARLLVSAPVPPSMAPNPFLTVARVRGACKLLGKFGVPPEAALAVVAGGPGAPDARTPTLDVEIEPEG